MESLKQHGFSQTQTVTKQVGGRTLVVARPFEKPNSMLGDSNQDRRESGTSLNKKRPSQQTQHSSGIVPLSKSASSSRPKPRPRHREASSPAPAEELLAEWQKKSQLEESSEDDNERLLRLSGTTKGRKRVDKASSSMAKSATSGIKKIRLTFSSPETTTSGLPSTLQPSEDSDNDDAKWYDVFSQEGKAVPSSAPRKDIRVEVSIGRGDGESIASASSEVFAYDDPVPAFGRTKRRPSISLSYDDSSEDNRQRRRFESGGRSRQRVEESDDDVVVVEKGKGKGKGKAKKAEEREKVPVKTKKADGKGKARQEEPSKSSKSTVKSKPSVTKTDLLGTGSKKRANDNSSKRKDESSPAKKASVPSKQSATSKKKAIRMGSSEEDEIDSDVSMTPRPKKKSRDIAKSGKVSAKNSARRDPTPPLATKTAGTKRKRTYEDDPTDFFSGYETSSRATARKKPHSVAQLRTPDKRGAETKSKRGKEKEKVAPRPNETTTKDKSAARTKEKGAATKEKPTRIASPTGFPSPMRAPVRVNEALLSSQLETEPQAEQPRPRTRRNSYGEEVEIAYGPNG